MKKLSILLLLSTYLATPLIHASYIDTNNVEEMSIGSDSDNIIEDDLDSAWETISGDSSGYESSDSELDDHEYRSETMREDENSTLEARDESELANDNSWDGFLNELFNNIKSKKDIEEGFFEGLGGINISPAELIIVTNNLNYLNKLLEESAKYGFDIFNAVAVSNNRNLLQTAIVEGNVAAVEILLNAGAGENEINNDFDDDFVVEIEESDDVDIDWEDYESPLDLARRRRESTIKDLFKEKANLPAEEVERLESYIVELDKIIKLLKDWHKRSAFKEDVSKMFD